MMIFHAKILPHVRLPTATCIYPGLAIGIYGILGYIHTIHVQVYSVWKKITRLLSNALLQLLH